MDASFAGYSDLPTYEDARNIAAAVTQRFVDGEIDRVQLVYTKFMSASRQEVVVETLMPLDTSDVVVDGSASVSPSADYEFEPNPDTILDALLPRYAEAKIYAALLNAAASEHAFRQRAMKAATDNADELIRTLSRVMNRARQDSITTEIMEIVGGAAALADSASNDEDDLISAH